MSDNFLSAEMPKQETDTGWIEYAILKFWEDCPQMYEYIADNAAAETEALRAQLEEMVEALRPFAHPDLSKILSGNKRGQMSIVYERDDAVLTIRDFSRAAEIVNRIIQSND